MPFGSVDVLKVQLGIPPADTSEDALLSLLQQQASTLIETYCNRTFGQATYTEYYSGDGTIELCLNQRPVISTGLVVYEDESAYWGSAPGAFNPSTTLLVYGTDYALEIDQPDGITSKSGVLQRIGASWQVPFRYMPGVISAFKGPGFGNVKAVYQAGYATIPADVQLALFLQVAAIRNTKNYGQLLRSESRGDGAGSQSYSMGSESKMGILTREVISVLSAYRAVAIA